MAPIRSAALLSILAALAALGAAFAAEWWGHLTPCALCLRERWPYRVVIGMAVVALVLPPRLARVLLVLGLLAMLAGLVLAVIHVGVEWGFWPSPLPECTAPHLTGSIAHRLAAMPERPETPCGTPVFPLSWLPVSMALLNLLYTLVFCLFLAMSVARPIPRRRTGRRGYA